MAKIDRVEVHEFTYRVPEMGLDAGRNLIYEPGGKLSLSKFVVVVRADNGARGEYVALWGATRMALGQTLWLAPQLLGRDPHERERIFDDFKRALRQYDHMGHGPLDIALWDLAGKQLGVPVSTLLGGYRKRLPTYASTLQGDRAGGLDSPEAFADFADRCRQMGYSAYKIHVWSASNASEVAATVRAVRSRVNDMQLMLDPACELSTFMDALLVGRACDEAGFLWYEDPFRDSGTSAYAHRKLRQLIHTPLLQTEHLRGIEPKADFLAAEATDLLRADPEYDMGITGTMKIAHLAEAFGVDVELHASGPAHRHCIAAIRNTNYYELALVGPKCGNPLPPVYACSYCEELDGIGEDGCFPVPDGPGLGVTYDWEWIDKHRTELHIFQ